MPRTKGARNQIQRQVNRHAATIELVNRELKQGKSMSDIILENGLIRSTVYRLVANGWINYKTRNNELKPEGTATQTP